MANSIGGHRNEKGKSTDKYGSRPHLCRSCPGRIARLRLPRAERQGNNVQFGHAHFGHSVEQTMVFAFSANTMESLNFCAWPTGQGLIAQKHTNMARIR
jgi:hypothetical protein